MAPTRWNDPLTSVSAVSRQETLEFNFFSSFRISYRRWQGLLWLLLDGSDAFCICLSDGNKQAAGNTSVFVVRWQPVLLYLLQAVISTSVASIGCMFFVLFVTWQQVLCCQTEANGFVSNVSFGQQQVLLYNAHLRRVSEDGGVRVLLARRNLHALMDEHTNSFTLLFSLFHS